MAPPANPCAKRGPIQPQNDENMGPQSQRRLTSTERTSQLKANASGHKKRRGGQLTLNGDAAFDPIKDCEICKARHIGCSEPHRGHHPLCWNNKRTKGITSEATLASNKEANRLKAFFSQPVQQHELFTTRNNSKEAGQRFFEPRIEPRISVDNTTMTTTSTTTMVTETTPTPEDFCQTVSTRAQDESFCLEHKNKEAPLAVLALAGCVVERMLRNKDTTGHNKHFQNGTAFVVPPANGMHDNPQHHSVVGQKLLLVDWKKTHGLELQCGKTNCNGTFKNDRTNFSKNKALFPVHMIDGPPLWCMVMSMVCSCCKQRVNANDSETLCRLPAFVAMSYPVDSKCALRNENSHIGRGATNVFDQVMTAYGNGDMCSRLLCSAVNNGYLERVSSCCSCFAEKNTTTVKPCVPKNGVCIKTFPPAGETIRELFDDAMNNSNAR